MPRSRTYAAINGVFYEHMIVSGVFDSILLSQDQHERKAPASTVADNNLTLIIKPMGLVVLS